MPNFKSEEWLFFIAAVLGTLGWFVMWKKKV